MLFNSFEFFLFFTVSVFFYWLLRSNHSRILWLITVSLIFYSFRNPHHVLILIMSILFNYSCAAIINKSIMQSRRKFLLIVCIVGNTVLLCFFKYLNFLSDILNSILVFVGLNFYQDIPTHTLPLGISFFTFQEIAYVIDVYKKNIKAEHKIVNFTFFVSFFAHLISGPILRAKEFIPQISNEKKFNFRICEPGIYLILWGLIKKVVIGDNLSFIVNEYFINPNSNFINTWIAIYSFAIQIYCDFSGYCDIAKGCAAVLGFEIPQNFALPYFSENITTFWHRWNITLSNWLRDYIFIPLGGAKTTELRYYINLYITMLIAGLWHGANYTFVLWGAYHGLILVLHKIYIKHVKICLPKAIGILVTFHLVSVGWVFFRANNIRTSFHILQSAFNFSIAGVLNYNAILIFLFFAVPLFIFQVIAIKINLKQEFMKYPDKIKIVCILIAVLPILLFGVCGNDFIYFDF